MVRTLMGWSKYHVLALLVAVVMALLLVLPTSAADKKDDPVQIVSSDGSIVSLSAAESNMTEVAPFKGNAAAKGGGDSGRVVDPASLGGLKGLGGDSIIGADTRYKITSGAFPNRAVVLLTFAGARCTGWMISADTVMTAGHCVNKGNGGGFYSVSSYRAYPGWNVSGGGASCRARTLYTNSVWAGTGSSSSRAQYDYGAVKLSCKIGNTVGWFGFRWTSSSLLNQRTIIQGYPGDKPYTQWGSVDRVRLSYPRQLGYQNDTTGGMSGSPVFNYISGGPYAMAIHAYGVGTVPGTLNSGTRITKSVFDFMISVRK